MTQETMIRKLTANSVLLVWVQQTLGINADIEILLRPFTKLVILYPNCSDKSKVLFKLVRVNIRPVIIVKLHECLGGVVAWANAER